VAPAKQAQAQAPEPLPYEGAAQSFRNIAPPGQNGHANAAELALFLSQGTRPPHNSDQLQMYEDLVFAAPELERADIGDYFKDASFGVRPGDVEETYQPCGTATDPCRPGPGDPTGAEHPCREVTVQRDAGFGVPHIYGGTRAGTMCAAGYVAAEDRLFLIDILRHAGRAELSSFVGGAEGNREMDREQWAAAPYTEQDLQRQIDQADELYGRRGRAGQRDLRAYIAGLNQYVFEARLDPRKMPGVYAAIFPNDPTPGPDEFQGTDVVAIASLVGGIFGKGGGAEIDSGQFFQAAQSRFGARVGEQIWEDFRSAEDPEAPTTVEERFPYLVRPERPAPGSLALPDPGSLNESEVVVSSSGAAAGSAETAAPGILDPLLDVRGAGSNALLVSARDSASGHPLAVFGPQTGYFSPQLLMEMDIHGPRIDARGVSFAGTNLYVQLGRGEDYSWSATSAGNDNIDTFALDLCEPGGGAPSLDSDHYRYRGRCRPFQELTRTNSWTPNGADQTPPGSETLRVNRTALGLEVARATLDGRPVVYVQLRSTYFHELDSARGFALFNNPNAIDDARDYQRAAHQIGYTFNWFYIDDEEIAYFNSGENPERAAGVDPNFPVRACPTAECEHEWKGYQPIRSGGELTGNRARYTPFDEHPQTIDKRFLTSWNNKQAPGYRANDANFEYHSLYRSIPLDERIQQQTRGGRTMTLVELIDAAQDAGTVDLRGDQVLPWLLEVLRSSRGPGAGSTAEPGSEGLDPEAPATTEEGTATGAPGGGSGDDPSGPTTTDESAPGAEDASTEDSADSAIRAAAAGRDVAEAPCAEGIDREAAIAALARWQRAGAHRRDMDEDGSYAHSCAIQLMDAWWPLLVESIFVPTLGQELYDLRLDLGGIDNEPNNHGAHLGSAYQGGFYGYVEKDVRTILGEDVRGRYSRVYCGGDRNEPDPALGECRRVLQRSLAEALTVDQATLYGDDEVCSSEEDDEVDDTAQYCFDTVLHTPAGAITQPLIHWINRPTFQQVVEIRDDASDGDGDRPGRGGGGGPDEDGEGRTGGDDEESGGGDGGGLGPTRGGEATADSVTAAAATGVEDSGRDGLPFTGLAVGALALLGVLLLLGGRALRRRS
jgi:hypothetical protein